ncbi:MAG: rubredoxin [Halobacteriota archaeon]
MAKWICGICEWVYDEDVEGVPFDELPDDWVCPACGVDKSFFEKESE